MRKEFCQHGHPLSGDNLYVYRRRADGSDQRMCRTCNRARNRKNQESTFWQEYRAAHLEQRRTYARRWQANQRRMRGLLNVIAAPAPAIDPIGLP